MPAVPAAARPADAAPARTAAFAISAEARRWFGLAVGSLVIAGLLSLAVVLGRIPGLSGVIDALGRAAAAPAPGAPPADAAIGWQAAAVACVLAGATWVATRAALPDGLDAWTRYEFSAWGAGHVLQVANTAAMLGVWLWLLQRATGRAVLTPRTARLAFTLLLAPHFAMPLLTARGALDPLYHSGATQLMRWGLFPVVLVVLALGLHLLPSMNHETKEPLLKRVLDNTWLLLALGVLIPFLSYTAWGWIELVLVPTATLP